MGQRTGLNKASILEIVQFKFRSIGRGRMGMEIVGIVVGKATVPAGTLASKGKAKANNKANGKANSSRGQRVKISQTRLK